MHRPTPLSPGPGKESVWDYPRPPRLEREPRRIQIRLGGVDIADTDAAYRVLETSHPPTYYLPSEAFTPGVLRPAGGGSVYEWKGRASYWTLAAGSVTAERAGWSYERPTPAFAPIAGFVAVYAGAVDGCWVGGERVTPQPGEFYGGWITGWVVGPFKGEPGSGGW